MSAIQPSPVRLAHLSDVHLPPPLPISPRALFNKRALSLLSWQQHRRHRHLAGLGDAVVADAIAHAPDAFAITGDLTNFGLPAEFAAAADWLSTLPGAVTVVPGNHDRMTPMPWTSGLDLWSRWMPARPDAFPYMRQVGDVALIGVNSAIASPPFMAYGRVGRTQGERLRGMLLRTRHLCRIVMIHHPPRRGLTPWRKSLLDTAQFAALLKVTGAEAVLHGHSHNASLATVPGTDIPLIGVASASLQSDKPWRQAGWNELSISRASDTWQVDLTRRRVDADGTAHSTVHRTWKRPIGIPGIAT
ncbi:metallophosphoesterase family protein [Neoasaia chiangmaiensis]|uniref:Calcineurin-like phosphoesterase domain-containing protein n=1 Tax=Neoasaia chiangmaiensis TaxID=320497 RepID=A0A1U9KUR0_9PROT|nr:metallophosphoesterase [Neoasaia chiangmaiensis]AQS89594.1 hypothetical protein A0U93_15100 [Neoasaia chiangmaiensis]